jgi:hypothetical protein
MSRRDQIKLSEAELLELLEGERVAVISCDGPCGGRAGRGQANSIRQ